MDKPLSTDHLDAVGYGALSKLFDEAYSTMKKESVILGEAGLTTSAPDNPKSEFLLIPNVWGRIAGATLHGLDELLLSAPHLALDSALPSLPVSSPLHIPAAKGDAVHDHDASRQYERQRAARLLDIEQSEGRIIGQSQQFIATGKPGAYRQLLDYLRRAKYISAVAPTGW